MAMLKVFDVFPGTGASATLRRLASRTTTDRLQLIRPAAQGDSYDLYANLAISPHEARFGARKMVSISTGAPKRLLRVLVPPGVTHGSLMRLKGLGNPAPDGRRGDLVLRVAITDPQA
jgi:DnaJ-class molecular chaperone